MTTSEHLDAILARCRANLALAEKQSIGVSVCIEKASKAGWYSTIAAVTHARTTSGMEFGANFRNADAERLIVSLIAAWPEELL